MSEKEVTDFVAASELPEQTLPSEKDIIQLALLIKSRNFSVIQKFIILDPTLREGHLDTLLRAIILSQLGLGQGGRVQDRDQYGPGGGLQHQDPRRRIYPGGVVQDTEVGSHRIIEEDEDDEDVYSIGVGEVH